MSDQIIGELEAYCYMIHRGGKPAASVAIQDRYLETAASIVESHGLKYHVEELSPGWKTFWVYQYPHILDVIKALPQAPETVFDHWALGKLFGYSEESIQNFLSTS